MICISFEIHNTAIVMYHSVLVLKVKKIVGLSFSKLSFKVGSVYMLPQSSNSYLFTKSSDILNKNTWGVKKCERPIRSNIIIGKHV